MLGGAWLAGALDALAGETGIEASGAEVVVGTSAGSALGALATGGIPPAELAAYACGRSLEGLRAGWDGAPLPPDAGEQRDAATGFRLARALPLPGPGSWRMALGTLARPGRHTPAALLAGWMPKGPVDTRPLQLGLERVLAPGWPAAPALWVAACDYRTGRRVAFGRRGAPAATVPEAVAASCAVPGFYRPVRIGGRCYVDGGVCSMSNLDLVSGLGLDLVVCLNPTSSRAVVSDRSPGGIVAAAMRASSGRRLGHEAAKLRREGTAVVLVQPGEEEVRAMGWNLMRRGGRDELAEQAARSTMRALRTASVRAELSVLGRRPGRPRAAARRRPARSAEAARRPAA
jgi:NTE family protein